MQKYFVIIICYCLFPFLTLHAQTEATFSQLNHDLKQINSTYVKHQDKCGTPKPFPQEQQQTLLQKLEDTYLLSKRSNRTPDSNSESLLYHAPNIAFAKLALYYGIAPLIAKRENSHRLLWDSLTVDSSESCESRTAADNIALAKLYLGLGAEMDFRDALKASLYEDYRAGDGWESGEPEPILKDEDYADDLEKFVSGRGFDQDNDDYDGHGYYRTPVTYWLEEYILRGFPTSMLETHLLLYPRFMKRASVEDIADILANPKKYKIPVNLNCPYRGAALESIITPAPDSEATCPLTPHINMRDAMGRTPLHIAKITGNDAVYDYLISQTADTNIKNFRDNPPIFVRRDVKPDEPASKQQKLETYFKILDEAALMPEVAEQLPDYKKILTNIYLHEQKPSNDELIKLDLFYGDFQAIITLDTMPRKLRYSLGNYRKQIIRLPDNWQEMPNDDWIDFLKTKITQPQIRLMLEKGLNPNKMLSPYGGLEEYSLLYAIVDYKYPIDFIKILLDAGANPNLTNQYGEKVPLDKAFELKTLDVAGLLIEYGAIIRAENNHQASFDKIMQEIIEFGFDDIDVPKTLLFLERLIKLGANPNTQIGYVEGDTYYVMTPISGLLEQCVRDDWPDENKDRSFYLDMMKLLVNEDTDWNAKNIYDYYHYDDDEDGSSTIADILKWAEKEMKADKSPYRDYDTSHCIEVVDYVKNYLKENNITIAE